MPVKESQRKATDKYIKENLEEIKVRVPKGYKGIIKKHCESRNESVNAFINRVISDAIKNDTNSAEV